MKKKFIFAVCLLLTLSEQSIKPRFNLLPSKDNSTTPSYTKKSSKQKAIEAKRKAPASKKRTSKKKSHTTAYSTTPSPVTSAPTTSSPTSSEPATSITHEMSKIEAEIHKNLSEIMPHLKELRSLAGMYKKKEINKLCELFLEKLEQYEERNQYQELIDFLTIFKNSTLLQLYNNKAVEEKMKQTVPKLPKATQQLLEQTFPGSV